MDAKRSLRLLETTSILLFYLQALRVIFSVMFGVIYDRVFAGPIDAWLGISLLLVLLALLSPALAPRHPRRGWMFLFTAVAALGRVALSVNAAPVRFWGALAVLAAGGLYLACMLVRWRPALLAGLAAALLVEQLLRAAGDTYDVSLRLGWLPVQAAWAALLLLLAGGLWRQERIPTRAYGAPGRLLWGLGVGGFLFLETSLLSLPNAIARWSEAPYALVAPLLAVATLAPLLPRESQRLLQGYCQRRQVRLSLSLLLLLALLGAYFERGALSALALLAAQVLALAGAACLLAGPPARLRSPGPWLASGMAFFLLLNFFNAFAFTYPYVLPFMRGLGWAVYGAAALAFGAAVTLQRLPTRAAAEPLASLPWALGGGALALAIAILAAWPRPVDPLPAHGTLRVGTYNVHYGYDAAWHFTLEEIARTIEASGADVIALQEVDTGRMTSYSVDDALYLARRLRMNAVYLPTVEHLTGIALLHRGPAELSEGRLLASLQEQTGIVHALLKVNGRSLSAFGTWLGLAEEDTQTQIRQALEFIDHWDPAVFGGDFNAEPDSPVARAVERAGFIDPFRVLEIDPPPATDPAIDPRIRIDHVWLRGVKPLKAWVSDSLASDHRMVVVELAVGP